MTTLIAIDHQNTRKTSIYRRTKKKKTIISIIFVFLFKLDFQLIEYNKILYEHSEYYYIVLIVNSLSGYPFEFN